MAIDEAIERQGRPVSRKNKEDKEGYQVKRRNWGADAAAMEFDHCHGRVQDVRRRLRGWGTVIPALADADALAADLESAVRRLEALRAITAGMSRPPSGFPLG